MPDSEETNTSTQDTTKKETDTTVTKTESKENGKDVPGSEVTTTKTEQHDDTAK
ncbi:hypothetical protein ACFS25_14430 [Spirosoma flavum]|uniref:Uncharacterized protein n=1 Tax=Spirosoma flavum TaxID=2048557 RepID=A0ABW6AHN2_9BACT